MGFSILVVGGLGLSRKGPSAGSVFASAQRAGWVTPGGALARAQSYAATDNLGMFGRRIKMACAAGGLTYYIV